MKTIKFRAWDRNSKSWYKPSEYGLEQGAKEFFSVNNEIVRFNRGDIELMQYTGLKDNNGKEIYEGDILNWSSWKLGFKHLDGTEVKLYPKKVVWNKGAWQLEGDECFNLAIYSNIEVIGNIYENPDLLKGENL